MSENFFDETKYEDAGSFLGRFWLSLVKDPTEANTLTRGTVGFLFSMCFLPLVFGHPWYYAFGVIFLTYAFPLVVEAVE